MINNKQDLKRYLSIEKAQYQGDMSNLKWNLISLIPFTVLEAVTLYKYHRLLRLSEYHINTGHRLRGAWYKTRLRRMQYKYGIMIPINSCKEGLRIQHLAQTRIGTLNIGKYFTIYPFCSIGSGVANKWVTIGDNVTFYSGARVVGEITIAHRVQVGANAVVTKSCDIEGAVLAGVPAKIIKTGK
jgi:serine O-acetyltransferase